MIVLIFSILYVTLRKCRNGQCLYDYELHIQYIPIKDANYCKCNHCALACSCDEVRPLYITAGRHALQLNMVKYKCTVVSHCACRSTYNSTSSCTAWFGSCTNPDRELVKPTAAKRLLRIVKPKGAPRGISSRPAPFATKSDCSKLSDVLC